MHSLQRTLLPIGIALAAIGSDAASAPVRIAGSPADAPMIEALERAYTKDHPGAAFSEFLHGPESTLAGTYTGTADIAFMARELRQPMERMAYQWAKLHSPLMIDFAVGKIGSRRPSTQIAVFVNVANPLKSLSIHELDAVFRAGHAAASADATRWSDLGVNIWRRRKIHPIGPPVDSIEALFFRHKVLADSRKWTPELRQLADAEIIEAVRRDPRAIAFASTRFGAQTGVRMLAISAQPGGEAILPNDHTVRTGSYPLSRKVAMVIAHERKQPVDVTVANFAAFVLSREGQEIIQDRGDYLALDPADRAASLHQLEMAR